MAYWLKITGTLESPFLDGDWAARRSAWLREYGSVSMFPRWPRMADGDVLIDYAAGSHKRFGESRIYAVEEVVSDPVLEPARALAGDGRDLDAGGRAAAGALPDDRRHRRDAALGVAALAHPAERRAGRRSL